MVALGIDTSCASASVAVVDDGRRLHACVSPDGASHSEALAPMVEECLRKSAKDLRAIDVIGIVTGPGSFTGLRIGISFTMGLCARYDTPAVEVSSLEAMALSVSDRGRPVRPVLDARRNEAFTALFALENGQWRRLEEDRIVRWEDFDLLARECRVVGRDPLANRTAEIDLERCPEAAAFAAQRDFGKRTAASLVRPRYLRLSAAEEKRRIGSVNAS